MTLPTYLARVYIHLLTPMTCRQIAKKTGLKPRTVSAYTQEIYEIFDVHKRKELQKLVNG